MAPTPVLSSQCVPLFIRELKLRRLPVEALRAKYALGPEVDRLPEAGLALKQVPTFADDCAALAKDPFFGLHVGWKLERGAYGLLEFAVRTSPTVRDAMLQIHRFSALLNGLVSIDLEETGKLGRLVHRIDGHRGCVGRQCNEFTLAVFVRRAQELTGGKMEMTRIQFAHPAPDDLGPLKKVFGSAALDFDVGENALVFKRSWLDQPTVEADPALARVLQVQVARELSARPARGDDFRGEVRAVIREQLHHATPQLATVAKRLALSVRTLQRKLVEVGGSFQAELEAVRESLARLYVKDPQIPLAEIAFALRYADLRSFARAWKRWTGSPLRRAV